LLFIDLLSFPLEEEVPSEPVDELTALNTFLDINSQAGTWIDEITIVGLATGLLRHGIIEGAIFMIFKERGTEWESVAMIPPQQQELLFILLHWGSL
jgi:hypothetical protein